MSFEHKEVTESMIGAAFEVHNVLDFGFLENVYQNAMQVELISLKLRFSGVLKLLEVDGEYTILGQGGFH